MYDSTFGPTALSYHIHSSDFKKYSNLDLKSNREKLVNCASQLANDGFSSLNVQHNDLAGRSIYQLVDFPSELVLRKAVENISRVACIKQANRIEICRCLRLFCKEGIPFTLAKFDIRNFYESITQDHIQELVNRRLSTLPSTRRVLSTFMTQCKGHNIKGLPRGLAISAFLSELFLNDFDTKIQSKLETHFYARYVDDIILLLSPEFETQTLKKEVSSMLPSGLKLNESKSKIYSFQKSTQKHCEKEHEFDYLGYSFSVSRIVKKSSVPHYRCVNLDISQSKIKKIKTRIVRALLKYRTDQNFDDLHDRFKLITCNYKFYDHQKQRIGFAGNYHSYGLIDLPSTSLSELDLFIKHILLSKSGKLSAFLAHSLSKTEREHLLRLSSRKGFENRIHFHFSPTKLKKLVECWKYA